MFPHVEELWEHPQLPNEQAPKPPMIQYDAQQKWAKTEGYMPEPALTMTACVYFQVQPDNYFYVIQRKCLNSALDSLSYFSIF